MCKTLWAQKDSRKQFCIIYNFLSTLSNREVDIRALKNGEYIKYIPKCKMETFVFGMLFCQQVEMHIYG